MSSWRELLTEAMERRGESFQDIVDSTLTLEQLDKEFDSSYGGTEGEPFTVWTTNRVYFPAQYDGSEWVASVARNPDGKTTPHVGGG
jgi:hypothetical protein